MRGAVASSLKAFLLGLMLAGCAAGGPLRSSPPGPGELPRHAAHHLFDLRWDLRRVDGDVQVVGLVQAKQVGEVTAVILELRGLDASGAEVSRRLFRVEPPQTPSHGESWPFAVRLTPSGQETRYALEVWGYNIGIDGNGMGGSGN